MKKIIVFLIGLSMAISPLKSHQNAIFKDRPWEFFEYRFIIKPEEPTFKKFLMNAIPASVVSAATAYAAHYVYENLDASSFDTKLCAGIWGVGGFVGAALAAHYIQSYFARRRDCLTFIQQWPHNKPYTPSEFHEHFDELYLYYKTHGVDATLKSMIAQTIKVVVLAIHHHFPQKYIPLKINQTGTQFQFHYGHR